MSLRFAIMTALIDDELSGYDLAQAFDQSLGFFWQASHQQIYRELAKLSELAWVSNRHDTEKGRSRRILYALTDSGRAALAQWVLDNDRMRVQETRDEFYIKLYNLSEENIEYLQSRLMQRREAMMGRLYLYERIRKGHYAEPHSLPLRRKGVYLALLGGIMQGQQYMKWCDEALRLLAEVQSGEVSAGDKHGDTA